MYIISSFNIFYIISFLNVLVIITSSAAVGVTGDTKSSANLTTLRLAQIITRHGDRAPLSPYENDIYKNASVYSINGWGELSEMGAKQVYELGAYLRQRYDGFLPRQYQKRDFLMLSSDVDRAIMSAESNLAGLYQVDEIPSRDIFKEWQPVPIHTIPKDEDNLIYEKADCPRYDSLKDEFMYSDEFRNFFNENKEFLEFVSDMAGITNVTKNFRKLLGVQDALVCQLSHNLTLPSWANETVIDKLNEIKGLSFAWDVRTDEMKRLKIGPLLERLDAKMRAKINAEKLIVDDNFTDDDPDPYRKIYIYSGHDTTITALLDSLNLFQPPRQPPFASALMIELHEEPETGSYFVEIFYRNDTTREPYKLDLRGFCEDETSLHICHYDKFSSNLKQFVPNDWKRECQVNVSVTTEPAMLSANMDNSKPLIRLKMAPDEKEGKFKLHRRHHLAKFLVRGSAVFLVAVLGIMLSLLATAALLYVLFKPTPIVSKRPVSTVYQTMSINGPDKNYEDYVV